MGFPLQLAVRYMGSKKRSFISMGTFFAILGVALGVAGLATAMSVTGGFHKEFRDKVLGVNAHVLILKRSSSFTEYRDLMDEMKTVPGVTGIAPFTINPMMVTRGDRTATGVMLKGVEPERVQQVLDLPKHIIAGDRTFKSLRVPGSTPPARRRPSRTTPGALPIVGEKQGSAERVDDAGLLTQLALMVEKDRGPAAKPGASPDRQDDAPFEAEARRVQSLGLTEVEVAPAADESASLELPGDAPRGSIVPEGGYQSALPSDDLIPADINPDPCASGAADLPGIVIGATLGENLRAGLGDCVQVTSPTIGFSVAGGELRPPIAKQFKVTGIFLAGFDQYDSKFVYTDIYQAQEFSDSGDSVTGIEMKVREIDDARLIARDIERRLGDGMHYTMDWEELNHGLFTALRIQQVVMSLVLALIIVVAAFTVIATLIMVVLDKRREIAVIKAMGASDNAILRTFLYQGAIVGLVGAVLGLAFATAACRWLLTFGLPLDPKVYFISHLPVDVRPGEFVLVGVFAVLVCLVATVWPAMHAAKLRPAEAFRG